MLLVRSQVLQQVDACTIHMPCHVLQLRHFR